MNQILKIALLQIAPCNTLEENCKKGLAACRRARKMGADIALFPEMFSCGYRIYGRPADVWTKEAISADSDFIRAFGALAKELTMAIGITFLEQYETVPGGSGPRNSLALFDCFGNLRFVYAKVHTCDFGEERHLTPGEDFFVTDLETS